MIFGGVGRPIVIDSGCVSVCCGFPESRTRKVGEEVPVVVGVPLITPLELRLRPTGNDPLARSHVFAPVPPEAANVTCIGLRHRAGRQGGRGRDDQVRRRAADNQWQCLGCGFGCGGGAIRDGEGIVGIARTSRSAADLSSRRVQCQSSWQMAIHLQVARYRPRAACRFQRLAIALVRRPLRECGGGDRQRDGSDRQLQRFFDRQRGRIGQGKRMGGRTGRRRRPADDAIITERETTWQGASRP